MLSDFISYKNKSLGFWVRSPAGTVRSEVIMCAVKKWRERVLFESKGAALPGFKERVKKKE